MMIDIRKDTVEIHRIYFNDNDFISFQDNTIFIVGKGGRYVPIDSRKDIKNLIKALEAGLIVWRF